jgi:hypothetical protein
MNLSDQTTSRGEVDIIVQWRDGRIEAKNILNTLLLTGRRALARSLANSIGDSYQFYITRMLFGDGGTVEGVKRFVDAGREGLFGTTRVSKPALANIDGSIPTQVIFTSVVRYDEAVGVTLNEMALQMANGDLYSMTTFPDLNKTQDMQITFNWRLNFV